MSKVLWHVTMSLDGFIAGPGHSMDGMAGATITPGVVDEMVATTGAILAGRRGYDLGAGDPDAKAYGGRWSGPIFVLTHHPDDIEDPGFTFLSCDIAEAVEIARAAAGGKNLGVFGADIARQCVQRGLIDEFYLHVAPVMLGDGIRLFEAVGGDPVRWARIHDGAPSLAVDLRYRPAGE